MKSHEKFYSMAEAYDVAFDFKDIPAECSQLLSLFQKWTGRSAESFLDLAAGPALHAVEMAGRGLRAGAVDLSSEMVQYGRAKAHQAGVSLNYIEADLREFHFEIGFDLAGIFMDSTAYLLTNQDFIRHLHAVARNLNPGGIYVLEMSHPRDVFSVGKSTVNSWETERDGLWTSFTWGSSEDVFDPITQITQTQVRMKIRHNGVEQEFCETSPVRCFTVNELKALILAEGSFEIVEMRGAFKEGIAFSNDPKAWRMIPVLRKR